MKHTEGSEKEIRCANEQLFASKTRNECAWYQERPASATAEQRISRLEMEEEQRKGKEFLPPPPLWCMCNIHCVFVRQSTKSASPISGLSHDKPTIPTVGRCRQRKFEITSHAQNKKNQPSLDQVKPYMLTNKNALIYIFFKLLINLIRGTQLRSIS